MIVESSIIVDYVCADPASPPPRKNTKIKKNLSQEQNTYSDYQEIKIQESVAKLGIGMIPKSLCLILQHDLVDNCKPGDDVTVVGKIMARWEPVAPFLKPDMQMCLRADSVHVNNGESDENWEGVLGGGEDQDNDLNARQQLKAFFL